VESSGKREFGFAEVRARGHSKFFNNIQDRTNAEGHGLLEVWMSHGDKVTELPPASRLSAAANPARWPRWPMKNAVSTPFSSTRK
jgi:GMP synthase (glutamine-hydrolysing)